MGYENLIVVVLASGMLLFGSKKLPDLFRSLGCAKSEYEKAKLEAQRELGRIQRPLDGGDTRRKCLEEIASKQDILNIESLSDEELTLKYRIPFWRRINSKYTKENKRWLS